MKVLIADDDDITRLLLGSALTKLGRILATSESRPEDLRFLETSATLVGRDPNREVVR